MTLPPLDYSFRFLTSILEAQSEVPQGGLRKLKYVKEKGKIDTKAIRFNNNNLVTSSGLKSFVDSLLYDPERLSWLDLSFNMLNAVEEDITHFKNLIILYLHGNNIKSFSEVGKLSVLLKLSTLTLHGNPLELENGYRHRVLGHLPQIRSLDFSGVTKIDKEIVKQWKTKSTKMYKDSFLNT
ncbi:leucine-rich repeat-containing protein 51-like [Limulus polyphemus]|uniref:Leucine-rich repeat-containing protein 51 n=1 Tax=Limulus polyphemus TaxID=6850 RepID=A0ABM1TE91_LIMPO|nr:leucine-rich repeat-containing protein 51-like [Limulus polyphemus]XP_022254196.1 leucine-rich repeat-containing protein 51-like [Limulus polyphemus]XP_022254197.1 leucine-rich repeat-containing protein 51-like [Limulus polyphemus]